MQAAQDLHKLGPTYVLIKGGHLIAAPSDPNRSSSDSQPSPSSAPSQTPSASLAAQDSESALASSAAQDSESASASSAAQDSDSESASASSAAQDSESASGRYRDTAQDATNGLDQPVSELNADSSLGEGHLEGQASSQHTGGGRAEQDTAQHGGKIDWVHLVSPLLLLYVHFVQPGSSCATCGCCKACQATLIQDESLAGSLALAC